MQQVLLNIEAVSARVGLQKSAIYANMKRGTFPLAVKIGSRNVRWWDNEITAWLENRPRYGSPAAVETEGKRGA